LFDSPLLSSPAAGRRWFTHLAWLLLLLVLLAFGLLAILTRVEDSELLVTGILLLASCALVFFIVPVRYEIWSDRLAIVFPLARWQIPLDTVAEARKAELWKAFGYFGVRFATSPAASIEIRRVASRLTRPNIIISPQEPGEFLRVIARLLEADRES
jgi:hypothetical protein